MNKRALLSGIVATLKVAGIHHISKPDDDMVYIVVDGGQIKINPWTQAWRHDPASENGDSLNSLLQYMSENSIVSLVPAAQEAADSTVRRPEVFADMPPTRTMARELGTRYYFTGEKCVNDHLAPRRARDSRCLDCASAAIKRHRHKAKENART